MNILIKNKLKKLENKMFGRSSRKLPANNREQKALFNDVEYLFVELDVEILSNKLPIDFDIYLYMERSAKILLYMTANQMISSEQIVKINTKLKGKLFVLKGVSHLVERYADKIQNINSSDTITKVKSVIIKPNEKISKSCDLVSKPNDYFSLWLNRCQQYKCHVENLNSAVKYASRDDIFTVLENLSNYVNSCYTFLLTELNDQDNKQQIGKFALMMNNIQRNFLLALLFCLRNNITNNAMVFRANILMAENAFSVEALQYYQDYWCNLSFSDRFNVEALVNIGVAVNAGRKIDLFLEDLAIFLDMNPFKFDNSMDYCLKSNT